MCIFYAYGIVVAHMLAHLVYGCTNYYSIVPGVDGNKNKQHVRDINRWNSLSQETVDTAAGMRSAFVAVVADVSNVTSPFLHCTAKGLRGP